MTGLVLPNTTGIQDSQKLYCCVYTIIVVLIDEMVFEEEFL